MSGKAFKSGCAVNWDHWCKQAFALQSEGWRAPEFAAGADGGEDVGGSDAADDAGGDVARGAEVGGVEIEDGETRGEALG